MAKGSNSSRTEMDEGMMIINRQGPPIALNGMDMHKHQTEVMSPTKTVETFPSNFRTNQTSSTLKTAVTGYVVAMTDARRDGWEKRIEGIRENARLTSALNSRHRSSHSRLKGSDGC